MLNCQNEAHLRQILSAISSLIISMDANLLVTYWNERAVQVFGRTVEEMLGHSLEAGNIPWDWPLLQEKIDLCRMMKRQVRLDDFEFTRLDGTTGVLGLVLSPLFEEIDPSTGCLIVGQDITDRKVMERQLAQAQKMESIGMLAAGIAHEINTPTQYVWYNIEFSHQSFAQLEKVMGEYRHLLEKLKKDEGLAEEIQRLEALEKEVRLDHLLREIPRALQQSLDGLDQVKKIVGAMKDYSHPGSLGASYIDLKRAIESTVTVARNEWKNVADVKMDFDPNVPAVECYPSELNQALLNLIVNAAQAIAETPLVKSGMKGLIRITTKLNNAWVDIHVSDSGTGIPKAIRNKIFSPFFTTKEMGRGSGQGLYITHQVIVEKHKGRIGFETEEGRGTTFTIRLPLKQEKINA